MHLPKNSVGNITIFLFNISYEHLKMDVQEDFWSSFCKGLLPAGHLAVSEMPDMYRQSESPYL